MNKVEELFSIVTKLPHVDIKVTRSQHEHKTVNSYDTIMAYDIIMAYANHRLNAIRLYIYVEPLLGVDPYKEVGVDGQTVYVKDTLVFDPAYRNSVTCDNEGFTKVIKYRHMYRSPAFPPGGIVFSLTIHDEDQHIDSIIDFMEANLEGASAVASGEEVVQWRFLADLWDI